MLNVHCSSWRYIESDLQAPSLFLSLALKKKEEQLLEP